MCYSTTDGVTKTSRAFFTVRSRCRTMNNRDQDPRVGESVNTTLEFGPPKFQATIPEHVRRILDVTEDDLKYVKGDEMEKVVVSAELTIEEVFTKDLGGEK